MKSDKKESIKFATKEGIEINGIVSHKGKVSINNEMIKIHDIFF